MRTEIIDFKEKKIRRCYDANVIDIDYTFDADKTVAELNKEFSELCTKELEGFENQYIVIKINLKGTEEEFEVMHLANLAAKSTLTTESTDINYLSTPLWFYDRINLVHSTQRDLGNYVNKYRGIQIIIKTEENEYVMVE